MQVSTERLRVSLAGASGYAGAGCLRLLLRHPGVEVVEASSKTQPGRVHRDVYPGSDCDLTLVGELDASHCQAVVSALAPGEAARSAPDWLAAGAVVLDLSADFRLRAGYERWYGGPHPSPGLLPEAVLALPELSPQPISEARLLALPGCFSTATLLACGPAAARALVEPEAVVDGKSGISGAGRSAGSQYLFGELDESVSAYSVSGHRHQPEMEQALSDLAGQPFQVTFVPHLVPMTRGLEVSCYLRLRPGVELDQVRRAYQDAYGGQPFVRLAERPVPTKQARGTNLCWVSLERQGPHLVAQAVLDNLGRGASSQAVQVLNLRFGMDPRAGLEETPWWP